MLNLNIHEVEKIELASTYIANGNSREVRITYHDGKTLTILLYGNTDALDILPKSPDFQVIKKEYKHEYLPTT